MKWVIAYDISCPKRLQRVYKHLCNHAFPLQNSVFMLQGSTEQFEACCQKLLTLIDHRADDLRIYALEQDVQVEHFGSPPLAEHIIWSGIGVTIHPISDRETG